MAERDKGIVFKTSRAANASFNERPIFKQRDVSNVTEMLKQNGSEGPQVFTLYTFGV